MTDFANSGLKPEILKAIHELGFENQMPIQEKVIPVLLETKNDLVGLAQTGTGKTAAFGLPLLNTLVLESAKPQILVLCPTRELCIQITNDFISFSKYLGNVNVVAVYGGASIEKQIRDIKQGAHIIIATPGRLIDLMERRAIDIKKINTIVLDEADEMLNMGFKEDLDTILSDTPENKRTLMFSATMPKEIAAIASSYMKDPVEIIIGKRNEGAATVNHIYYMVNAHDRYLALKRVIDIFPDMYGLVFCRTRQETKEVAEKLMKDGYSADALHGDLSQQQRDTAMQKFRLKNLQLLVATDVAARGLDVNELSHVINYNLPDDIEVYTHRSGRTGRAGKTGTSVSIIHSREQGKIRQLEKIINKSIERKMIPQGKEICEKQLFNLISKIETSDVDLTQIDHLLPSIYSRLSWLSKEELIQKITGLEFKRLLAYYEKAADLNKSVPSESKSRTRERSGQDDSDFKSRREDRGKRETRESGEGREGRESRKSKRDSSFARFFINVGSKDGLKPQHMIGLILDHTNDRHIEIGKIDIMHKFSFFEVEASLTEKILKSFEGAEIDGRRLIVDLAQGAQNSEEKENFSSSKPDRKDSEKSFRKSPDKFKKSSGDRSRGRSDRGRNESSKKDFGNRRRSRKD